MLDYFKNFTLSQGSHASVNDGLCAMEAVSWLAGEIHSDMPQCADLVTGRYVQVLNDQMSDEERNTLLKPYIPRIIGTKGTNEHTTARMWLVCDAAVRKFAPLALTSAGLTEDAAKLSSLLPVTDSTSAKVACTAIDGFGLERARIRKGPTTLIAAYNSTRCARRSAMSATMYFSFTKPAILNAVVQAAARAAYYAGSWKDALEVLDAMVAIKPGTFDCEADECLIMLEKMLAESHNFGSCDTSLRV